MKTLLANAKSRWFSSIAAFILLLSVAGFFRINASALPRGLKGAATEERLAGRTPLYVEGGFLFSAPLQLMKSPVSPVFFQQDAEPEIKIDIFGNIYVTAINGVPGGTDLWKSTNNGASFAYLGQPDGLQDHCTAPTPQCVAAGGADDSIDVSSGGYLYVSSLYVGSVTTSTSMDGGTGGALPGQAWTVNTISTGLPVQDRQWVAAYGPQTLNMTVRQAPGTGDLTFVKSVDAGKTFSPPVIVRMGNSTEGNLVVDPFNGNLYTTAIPGTALTEIHLLKSTDGGTTWSESTIVNTGAGTNPGHKFTMLAVDRGGNLHLAYSSSNAAGNCHVFLMSSADQGATWLPPVRVDNGTATNTAVQPWIIAGSPGVVDVTWLGSSGATPDVAPFNWQVFFAQTRNALSATPTFTQSQVTSTPVHDTNICFNGTGCTGTANRDLLEYYTMTLDPDGNAAIAYADSVNGCNVATCKTNAWFAKQTGGLSAYAPPAGPAPASFAPNIPVGAPGAEPSLWVDSYNCIYVTAPGHPWVWKSVNNGVSFLPPVNPVADEMTLTGGDEDIITLTKADGTRPDQVYFTDLGLSSDHIRKSTDGGTTYFKPGPGGAAGDTGISSDRQWLAVDRIGPDQYVYEVDHELASEVVRLSSLANDTAWITQSTFTDPELTTTVPNTNPGPVFVNKQTHQIIGIFNASIPQTNAMNPPFGKLLNIWNFVAEPPTVPGGAPVLFKNYPINRGVIDSPTTPPPIPGTTTYGTNNANIFPAGDVDSAGNLYAVWSMNNARTNEFSIWFASSHDGGKTFYGPFPVSSGALSADETAVLPWIAAGDNGRVDIVWYKTSTVGDPNTLPKPPDPNAAQWNLFFAQSTNANTREPVFTVVQAGDHVMHQGQISTGGLIGTSDRSLLDYFEVNIGPDGLANIIYADNGSSATHAEFARQNGGPLARINPVIRTCLAPSIIPLSAVSRKTHGAAGAFDINMPLTGPTGVECRSGGPGGNYQIVVTFANAVTASAASITSGTATVQSVTTSGPQAFVNLAGVTTPQKLTISIDNVSDGTHTGAVSIQAGICVGDSNGDRTVNSGDAAETRSRSGQLTSTANFRSDVNTDGTVNSGDST
ncbi:MAG: hypothetical protein M3Z22_02785, partial [Verrucomicrobiota bacterium]|nr:hypothetical protein [Verrucomicrobiota bacterium]